MLAWSNRRKNAQTRGLQRVVTPDPRGERAADHRHVGLGEQHAHLAQGVGDIDLRLGGQGLTDRAARHLQAQRLDLGLDRGAPVGMAWRDHQQHPGRRGAGDEGLLARMGAGGEQHAPAPERQTFGGRRQGSRDILEVEDRPGPGAEIAQSERRGLVLRQDQIKGAEQGPRRGGAPGPGPRGLFGNARRDQPKLHPPRPGPEDQVRPKLAFREQRRVGPPVVEKPRRGGGPVYRRELVDHARRQTAGEKLGRGHRS